jgi:hypothetical protein
MYECMYVCVCSTLYSVCMARTEAVVDGSCEGRLVLQRSSIWSRMPCTQIHHRYGAHTHTHTSIYYVVYTHTYTYTHPQVSSGSLCDEDLCKYIRTST